MHQRPRHCHFAICRGRILREHCVGDIWAEPCAKEIVIIRDCLGQVARPEETLVGVVTNQHWYFQLAFRSHENGGIVGDDLPVDHREAAESPQ